MSCFESLSPDDFPKEEGTSRTLRKVTDPLQGCFMLFDLFTPSLLTCCSDTAQSSSLENNPEKIIQAGELPGIPENYPLHTQFCPWLYCASFKTSAVSHQSCSVQHARERSFSSLLLPATSALTKPLSQPHHKFLLQK